MRLGFVLFLALALVLLPILASGASITSCANLVSGSHTLDNDITGSGTCINITNVNNVVLECQGNTINYDENGNSRSIGMNISNSTNVTINDCIIKDINSGGPQQGYGINVVSSTDIVIFNNSITTNTSTILGSAIFIDDNVTRIRIDSNNITTGASGSAANGGITTSEIYDSNITNNIILTSGSTQNEGIRIQIGNNNRIVNNTIETANSATGSDWGISLTFNANNTLVANNTITTHSPNSWGFRTFFGARTGLNFTGNTITTSGSSAHAVHIYNQTDGNYTNNELIVSGSGSYPIYLTRESNATFENNVLNSSERWLYADQDSQSNMTNTTFRNSFGSISINPQFPINATQDIRTDVIDITLNKAFLNSTNLTFMNLSGLIVLNNITLSNPWPYVDFDDDGTYEQCFGTCSGTSFVNNIFTFNVAHFTAYRAQENPAPGGPAETSSGGSGQGYDERYTSTEGIYDAQFGDKPQFESEDQVSNNTIIEEEREKIIEEPVKEIEPEEKIAQEIKKEEVNLEQKIEERNTKVQTTIIILIFLTIALTLFFLMRKKKEKNKQK